MHATGIHAGHKTRPARRADGALTIRVSERSSLLHQGVNRRRLHVLIAESADRIEPLLVGAVPENVRARSVHV